MMILNLAASEARRESCVSRQINAVVTDMHVATYHDSCSAFAIIEDCRVGP